MNFARIRSLQTLIGWHMAIAAMAGVAAWLSLNQNQTQFHRAGFGHGGTTWSDLWTWLVSDGAVTLPVVILYALAAIWLFLKVARSANWASVLGFVICVAAMLVFIPPLPAVQVLMYPLLPADDGVRLDPASVISAVGVVAIIWLAARWPTVAVAGITGVVAFCFFGILFEGVEADEIALTFIVTVPISGVALASVTALSCIRKVRKEVGPLDLSVALREVRASNQGHLPRILASEASDLLQEICRTAGFMRNPEAAAPQQTDAELADIVSTSLATARKHMAMTQQHLAQAAVVGLRTVQRAEATGRISFENLRSICSVLGIAIPVPEARIGAIEPPFAWRGIGTPLAQAAILSLSCGFGMGWVYSNRRSRAWHMAASISASTLLALLCHTDVKNIFMSEDTTLLALFAVASFPTCLSFGSIFLGIAFRQKSSRRAILLAIPSIGALMLPISVFVPLMFLDAAHRSEKIAHQDRDGIHDMIIALSEQGASRECIAFAMSEQAISVSSYNLQLEGHLANRTSAEYYDFWAKRSHPLGSSVSDAQDREASLQACERDLFEALGRPQGRTGLLTPRHIDF